MDNNKNICLFCSSPEVSLEHEERPSTSRGGTRANDTSQFLFLLHKLLQIPFWKSCEYLSSSYLLCFSCKAIVQEGRDLVEKVEQFQMKLQTLQATLQNLILSSNGNNDGVEIHLKTRIREEIHNNINFPAVKTTLSGQEIPANSEPLREDRIIMDFEAGEVKMEQGDHITFEYDEVELIDFVPASEESIYQNRETETFQDQSINIQNTWIPPNPNNEQSQPISYEDDNDDDVVILEETTNPSSTIQGSKRKRDTDQQTNLQKQFNFSSHFQSSSASATL